MKRETKNSFKIEIVRWFAATLGIAALLVNLNEYGIFEKILKGTFNIIQSAGSNQTIIAFIVGIITAIISQWFLKANKKQLNSRKGRKEGDE